MAHRQASERGAPAERFAALSRVGTALMSELDEEHLLHMIAETARELTDATFAAFTLRPVDETGQPSGPSEGNLFQLAAVVGVTEEQEELFRHMSLGGEGLLAPIFRYGVPVLVGDALSYIEEHTRQGKGAKKQEGRDAAFAFSHGTASIEGLRSQGVPRGHPVVRSFLGAPLLDREKRVRGGLLVGHTEPNRFTPEDEALLAGLAAQAAVALENARLYRVVQMRAQELHAIFESIADGVTQVDQHGTIVRENGTARHLREQLQTSSNGQQAFEALLHIPARNALNGKEEQGSEVTVNDGNEELRTYIVNASPLRPPRNFSGPLQYDTQGDSAQPAAMGAVVVWHDVTETRRLLIERREHAETEAHRAQLQMILDELPSSVYLVSGHDARLVLANRGAATLWGATWQVGLPMADFLKQNNIRIFSNDGHELLLNQLATLRAVRNAETVHHHQEVIRHADGTALPVLVNAVAIDARAFRSGGFRAGTEFEPAALVVHQDVTALKDAERLKDEFIGIAAHELRTPLAILKGFAQTLIVQTARGKGPELNDWQMEALQGIDQATIRMVELIDDLLDVTRLQAGRLELHIEPVDIVAMLQRILKRQQITTEQHTLSLLTPLEHLVVQVDPRRMEQVLNNLINNAIKYSPIGGNVEVTIEEDAARQVAIVSVRDFGIGIPVEQQARVFGRFVRADNARAHGIGGTGLGLYLCRELVERHGGRIWFESQEEEGSTFHITLPLFLDPDSDAVTDL
ncbi:MAG TPA: ATP-binding protein [Ktedonobacteraceae bacterium]|nr:ATP-binding protein [Ktedonobacteraceae bacterium]